MLGGITAYLYFRLERKLMTKVDTTLQIALAQSLLYLNNGDKLAFQNTLKQRSSATRWGQAGIAARLITVDGKVVDGFGPYQEIPHWLPEGIGYKTLAAEAIDWRLMSQPVIRAHRTIGWLQVAQSMEQSSQFSRELLAEIWLNLPLFLGLTAVGGWVLANHALRPIQSITQTVQTITASDLNQRIHHLGVTDEIGQLAMTFDQMLDRLQAAFEREQRFTADAAHELRTPLAAIKVRIGVTRSRSRSPEDYEETLQTIEQEVDRLIRLSNGLLLLAKIDQGHLPVSMQAVDLSVLLGILVEQIQPLAVVHQSQLINQLPAQLWVKGDPDQLTSLFLNLLDNAVKHTPAAGKARLWLKDVNHPANGTVQVAVSNTGTGISPEHLPHLFDRFYRVESARSRHRGGAGLGLAIAYEITRIHGGTITVQSEPEQETTFTVTLPMDAKTSPFSPFS